MSFPESRPRRLRRSSALRRMVRETTLSPDNFLFPLFVCPGKGVKNEISSLPGQYHFSVDMLAREAEEIAKLGIPAARPGTPRGPSSARSARSRRPRPI